MLAFGLAPGLAVALLLGPPDGVYPSLFLGLVFGLVFGRLFGGAAYLQHYCLRCLPWREGAMPWHYVRFLDEATERKLLQRVGGGYRFIHPLFRDYFASLKVTSTSQEAVLSSISQLRRTALLIGLALIIIAGNAGLFSLLRIHKVAVDNAYATATAQVVATATTAEQMYASATSGTPVIDDPLIDNSRGYSWTVATLIASGTNIGTCTFSGGAYHIIAFKGYWIVCGPYSGLPTPPISFSDFAFQVQMKIIKGDTGGIGFRMTNSKGGYEFYITPEGSYTLFSHDPVPYSNTSTRLLNGSSSAIRTGLNQSNLIAVLAQGNTITLYVNNQYIGRVVDTSYNKGFVVVSAYASINPTEILYSNAKVWTLL